MTYRIAATGLLCAGLLAACDGPSTIVSVPASQGALNMYDGRAAVQTAPAQPGRYFAPNVAAAQPNLGPSGADLLLPKQQP
ncbi:hypothetical protein PSA7680_00162 [Pseudoruegeria aquimaris]|uniref:Lipoprotein n=1 Tax=Pseudoruegeria aquimaris TaxID=393663 RepID=A0A1Y5R9W4_9RHOB|nr:hypothetical protein [Pseudoruegeria aquimaris]SLN11783.1 hypothetical protein PSA7680_00162 [Pseudoruegeria aquimaris]